jgi:colanic acid biosynthesis protein WcaH
MEKDVNILSTADFMHIVQYTPLISIDLLIYNASNEVLMGWRKNFPARDCWFVPGGRIRKDETIREAFARITESETGIQFDISEAEFHGVYEHLYPGENAAGRPGFGTHYVVLAFELKTDQHQLPLPKDQHVQYCWMPINGLLTDAAVHQNVKNYFNGHETF